MKKGTRHLLLRTTQGGPWVQDPGWVKRDSTVHSSSNNNKHLMISSPASVTKGTTNPEALSSELHQMEKSISGLILHSYWKNTSVLLYWVCCSYTLMPLLL